MDLNELLERVERLEARGEIEDLLGEYLHLRMAGDGQGILDRIWARREDIRIEYGASGPYQSRAKVATFYQKDHLPGKFTLMQANTPVIRGAGGLSCPQNQLSVKVGESAALPELPMPGTWGRNLPQTPTGGPCSPPKHRRERPTPPSGCFCGWARIL